MREEEEVKEVESCCDTPGTSSTKYDRLVTTRRPRIFGRVASLRGKVALSALSD